MSELKRTVLYDRHAALGAKIVEFGGWEMPLFYPTGIVEEHLVTRKSAGLFDVSHMGRFTVRGEGAQRFLNHVLTNNAGALDMRMVGAQYTLISKETGGTVDDAFLYRFSNDEFLLVVNAANTEKDWVYLQKVLQGPSTRATASGRGNSLGMGTHFPDTELINHTEEIAMLSLQGPDSRKILEWILDSGLLPEPMRNAVSVASLAGAEVRIARTGYTGEPLCFELFLKRDDAARVWDLLLAKGAAPSGLGARDTLRLEAGLPLYGHELGQDPEGKDMPLLTFPFARVGLSFSPAKGEYIGREALARQFEALGRIMKRDYSMKSVLPRIIQPVAVAGRGVARSGAGVVKNGKAVGFVTSGTMVPCWVFEGEGLRSVRTDQRQLRSICLACMDCEVLEGDKVTIDIRGKQVDAIVVPYHLRSEAPPYARPIPSDCVLESKPVPSGEAPYKIRTLLEKTLQNTLWRQQQCINLIPSEMTPSPLVRLLSVMDPAFRYAEHRKTKAFCDAEVYYYQGTDFIDEVERALQIEMCRFLGCAEVETRVISGQMANMTVFSAMVDYINRTDRKHEPRRIRQVMNNYIGKGGHLSAQPMGALRDFVARDPKTERPGVVPFQVLRENPYKIDVPETLKLIDEFKPEFIIFGKSMVLHKEPIAEIRRFVDDQKIDAVILYDMAHVLGLVGPHFQEPFKEGADLVTGSTHKTFFGTQRGIVGSPFLEHEERYELWNAVLRRSFPGSLSNHHLGTMLGLLAAAYEMNTFKDEYQKKVITNAKAFGRALKECGLKVAGDPAIDFTETHQVIVNVGYGRGPEAAKRLEDSNIICNYQAMPDEEGFTASGALRMGVSEMTRFGMGAADFRDLAVLISDAVVKKVCVIDQVRRLRARFCELQYCFKGEQYEEVLHRMHELL